MGCVQPTWRCQHPLDSPILPGKLLPHDPAKSQSPEVFVFAVGLDSTAEAKLFQESQMVTCRERTDPHFSHGWMELEDLWLKVHPVAMNVAQRSEEWGAEGEDSSHEAPGCLGGIFTESLITAHVFYWECGRDTGSKGCRGV